MRVGPAQSVAIPAISVWLCLAASAWAGGSNWNGDGTDTIGLYDAGSSTFLIRNSNSSGPPDLAPQYGPPGSGWLPLSGDWDGDGVDTVGLYDPATGTFYLRNSNTPGFADLAFRYGPAGAALIPLVGDWDGDGVDTVGLYDPARGFFALRNSNSAGLGDVTFRYGLAGAGWAPVVGDWDGNGTDTVGLYDPVTATFYLRNSNTEGFADVAFQYGPAGAAVIPLSGDWNHDGIDTVGLYQPARGIFALRNSNTAGLGDIVFQFGPAGPSPVGTVPSQVLEETSTIDTSASPDFWLSSGARFFFVGGFGRTLQGDLPANDHWRVAYSQSNPVDTDNGFHPQNVFRLINRNAFDNFTQELSFTIHMINPSPSPNRRASNGVFLFLRYGDENHLYVAGVRVDGAAVIKKKIFGTFFTLAEQQIYPGSYDRDTAPNLIPIRNIALGTEIHTNANQTVSISLSVDGAPVLQATDDGFTFGGEALTGAGLAGIASDFMDVEFSRYHTIGE